MRIELRVFRACSPSRDASVSIRYIYIYKRESGVHVYSVITETHNQL